MQDAIGSQVLEKSKIDLLYNTLREWCPGMKQPRFAGGHPVSVASANIGVLQQFKHMVSVKADGTRCMAMFMRVAGNPVAVIHYRNGDFFRLNVQVTDGLLFDGTLFDMEQMSDCFMVFDVYVLRSQLIVDHRYSERVRIAEDLLEYVESNVMEIKPVYKPSQMHDLIDACDGMKNDGLILTRDEPGGSEEDWLWRRSKHMLKWKRKNTIDLYVDEKQNLFWSDKGIRVPVRSLLGYEWPQCMDCPVGIYEFEITLEANKQIQLKLERARPDVIMPNDVSTVTFNLESVIDNIDFLTIQAMLGQIHIGKRVKYQ